MTHRGSSPDRVSFLEKACADAMRRVSSGYYRADGDNPPSRGRSGRSLLRSLVSPVSVIAEIKPRSPVAGKLREVEDVVSLVREMVSGGADAFSVLTDPDNFGGRAEHLREVSSLGVSTLMKDFVVSAEQLEFAAASGASAVLLILRAFKLGLTSFELRDAVRAAHDLGLEVLLEVYRPEDVREVLAYDADVIGVNSRDLEDLSLSLGRARNLLAMIPEGERWRVVVESGIRSHEDVKPFLEMGVNKFLVGTAIMSSGDVASAIRRIKGG
ncbi:MAG: indole-3-glycerol-phosphate synthase [Aigarchaeota archaeon]|nr:indole-3-glycerol-phosphate synthase [Candidatus Calditenuis fumarioli]